MAGNYLKEIIGIGCSLSDVCVLEKVGKSFAIGNACCEIKSIALEVVGTNDEKGVQEVLKKYL
jgi:hydroxymethylpyrimidine pyrophosphatase-like HAD family hydrolase